MSTISQVRVDLAEFAADPTGMLDRLIETRQTVVVERDGEAIAVVRPVPPRKQTSRRQIGERDRDALRAAFGGWEDVDTDRLVADVYADRRADDRPPVEL